MLVRTPRCEDHLRVLCVHWLTDGGANQDRLRDIYYLVENRPKNFDWDRCLNVVDAKRRRWIVCCIGLARKYLGLNLDDTPLADEAKEIPEWLCKTVESEWRDEIKIRPLQNCLHDRKLFWRQLKKRVPPNPIQATVELNGDFDHGSRIYFQAANVLTRFSPAVKRVGGRLLKNFKAKNER
jgi:hypothetical protein